MIAAIQNNIDQLKALFQKHSVKKAYVFGSALGQNFGADSDIDFLIAFESGLEPLQRGELWWSLYDELRKVLGRNVDLINEQSLKNPYFIDELYKTRQLIYG